ncbi:hypothetical protein [Algoriphagus winogradskyi]|uniref:PH domain-containing protein n=1 Tax=Algoriphagus winogradskyi TaxID=237017 RepID=A0ABY1NLL9_9BACT|nr:hypothetical protein [Algoriphagus winogradskyi]SMP12283.1 hypothetical protein SAMN06265367_10293 [Algoriphagus winogradskyi]
MSRFNYKTGSSGINGPRLLGVILISAGIIVLLVPVFHQVSTDPQKIGIVGGGSFFVGLVMVSIYTGTQIDFHRNRFKAYQSILWIKIGDWQELPKIENAELILHSFRSTNTPNGISPTLSRDVTIYKCVLLSNGAKFLALDFAKEKDAVAALEEIKKGFGI